MSFSLSSIYERSSWSIWTHSTALSQLQEQAATGQRLNKPSDDPTDASRVLNMKSDERSYTRYIATATQIIDSLSDSDISLNNISRSIIDANNKLTSGSSSAFPATLADTINGILEDIVLYANTKDRYGNYMFSGSDSDTQSFDITRNSAGEITRVSYQGSNEVRTAEVSPGVQSAAVLVGESIFQKDDNRQIPTFMSADQDTGVTTTGAVAGSGTSSVRGTIQLTVTSTGGTTYDISIDGGTTTVAIDTASDTDVAVVNPTTGEVLYVDVSNISSSGTEWIQVGGTYDVFNALITARDLLRTDEKSMPSGQWDEMVNKMIGHLSDVHEDLTKAFPLVGGRISTLTALKYSLEDMQFNTEDAIAQLQDADIAQIAIDLARHEVLYEMSLAVASKMFSLSLMDFLG